MRASQERDKGVILTHSSNRKVLKSVLKEQTEKQKKTKLKDEDK